MVWEGGRAVSAEHGNSPLLPPADEAASVLESSYGCAFSIAVAIHPYTFSITVRIHLSARLHYSITVLIRPSIRPPQTPPLLPAGQGVMGRAPAGLGPALSWGPLGASSPAGR